MQEVDQPNMAAETHGSKKRKMSERVVVAVKIEENVKKQYRNEGPPSDCWSWRKYGQKPIKGSPYPRGYYRCSTSKGCSARKQVEICKTDSSKLIITYTSTHNHPGPDFSLLNNSAAQLSESPPTTPNLEQESETTNEEIPSTNCEEHLQYSSQSPLDPTSVRQEVRKTAGVNYSGEPVGLPPMLKPEENDFYDELEELPTSSFFMKNSLCEERVAVNLS